MNLRFEKTFSKASFCPILHIFADDKKVAQFDYELFDDIYITLKGDYDETIAEMVYACDYEAKRCQPPKKLDKNLLDIELRKIFPQNLQNR